MTPTGSLGDRSRQRIRRDPISVNEARRVAALAAAGAVAGALAHTHPTSWSPADVVLSAGFVAAVVWAAACAPWWLLAATGFAAVLLGHGGWIAVAVVAFLAACITGWRDRRWPVVRALSAGLSVVALLHSTFYGFHGATALVTGAAGVAIFVTGVARRGPLTRGTVRRVAIGLGALAALAVGGAAVAALQAYRAIEATTERLRDAAEALRTGDVDGAGQLIEASRAGLATAQRTLDRPWARPAVAVPVLSQHIEAARQLLAAGQDLAETAAAAVPQIDVDALTMRAGVVDLGAIRRLDAPTTAIHDALDRMDATFATARSPWLVGAFGNRLRSLEGEIDGLVRQSDVGLDALTVAPRLLGVDGPRTYFVAFTNPAVARGLGGAMRSWAELRLDHGRVTVARVGETATLTAALQHPTALAMPPDYLARYGGFGAGDGTDVGLDVWSNVTMSPDLPSVAEVIAQLYPRSGGTTVDGVIVVDVYAVAQLLSLTGPVNVPGLLDAITAQNVVDYVLRDQYTRFPDPAQRDLVLAALSGAVVQAVFDGSLPGPRELADAVAPAVADGRLLIWSRHDEDQPALRRLGIAGDLPAPAVDGLAVVADDVSGNEVDAGLQRDIVYRATVDTGRGRVRAALDVRLTNALPADPAGGNRSYLSVYSPWRVTSATIDGQPVEVQSQTELGWWVVSLYVDIAPGVPRDLRLEAEGSYDPARRYTLDVRAQPSALADTVRLDVRDTSGDPLVEHSGPVARLVPPADVESAAPAPTSTAGAAPPTALLLRTAPPACAASTVRGMIDGAAAGSTVTVTPPTGAPAAGLAVPVDGALHATFEVPVPAGAGDTLALVATGTRADNGAPFSASSVLRLGGCLPPSAAPDDVGGWVRRGLLVALVGLFATVVARRRLRPLTGGTVRNP